MSRFRNVLMQNQPPSFVTCEADGRKFHHTKFSFNFLPLIASTCSSLVLLAGLVSVPAYADKIIIPPAAPFQVKSVELWQKCMEEKKSLQICQKIRAGHLDVTDADLKLVNDNLRSQGSPEGGLISINGTPSSPPAPLSSFGENLLNGFTDFLVDRAKQEARLYLQDELTNHFCEGKNKDWFRNTCNVLTMLKTSNYSMSGTPSLLRTSIRDDLRNYPDSRFQTLYDADSKSNIKYLYARLAFAIYRESRGSRDISEIIGGLAEPGAAKSAICSPTNNDCTSQVDKISSKAKVYWVLSENLRMLRAHLGAQYESNRENALRYAVAGAALGSQDIQRVADNLFKMVALLDVVQNYRQQIENLEAQADQGKTNQANLTMRLRATLTGITALGQIEAVFCTNNPTQCTNLSALQAASSLAQAVLEEDFSRIILEAVTFEAGGQSQDCTAEADKQNMLCNKYLPLVVELASAQSSADMQKIIEVAAAPAGSYREKFNSDSLTSITALAGIAGTLEQYGMKEAPDPTFRWQPFLPVGVQHTWKFGGGDDVGGIFVSLIDVGTLAMSRQGDSTVSANSNTGWAQVFSPGIYGTYNLSRERPIVIGLGVARTPKLVTTNTGEQASSTRIQAFLALDLTLFAFR